MMTSRRVITLPTAAALDGSLRVPVTDPSLPRTLLRLSRPALLSVIQEWLKTRNQSACGPVLGEDESNAESPYDTAQTLDELREVYAELEKRKGGKREVVDRVLEGDWRHGVSLRQLAMLDIQILLDYPACQRWTARKLERIVAADDDRGYKAAKLDAADEIPRLRGPTFVKNLQQAIGSMVKAHYYLTHLEALSVSLLRIQILDSPYNSQASFETNEILKSGETLFVAFPDHSPHIYLSTSTPSGQHAGSASLGLRKVVTDTIARALSQPQARYTLKNTNLIARTLSSMTFLQGASGYSNALGGWSIFAAGTVERSPLVPATGYEDRGEDDTEDSNTRKRAFGEDEDDPAVARLSKQRRVIAQKRFGRTGVAGDGRGIERFDVRLENAFSPTQARKALQVKDANRALEAGRYAKGRRTTTATEIGFDNDTTKQSRWRPQISLTFHGTHVFAGVRGLVEAGVIDGVRMPGWMTGEHGVSAGVVRNGLMMKGRKGA